MLYGRLEITGNCAICVLCVRHWLTIDVNTLLFKFEDIYNIAKDFCFNEMLSTIHQRILKNIRDPGAQKQS